MAFLLMFVHMVASVSSLPVYCVTASLASPMFLKDEGHVGGVFLSRIPLYVVSLHSLEVSRCGSRGRIPGSAHDPPLHLARDNKLNSKKKRKKKSPVADWREPAFASIVHARPCVYCTVDYVTLSVAARCGLFRSANFNHLHLATPSLSHALSPCFAFKFSNHALVSTQSISFLQQNKDSSLIAPCPHG